jgi:biotin carboxyl carrier protein
MHKNQNGLAHLAVIMVVLVAIAVGGVGYYVFTKDKSKSTKIDSSNAQQVASESKAKIKHLGINLDYYNSTTNKAGDIEFTKAAFGNNNIPPMIFMEYGYEIPASSAGQAKRNPQPTFIAPLGTKVHSLVDGEVADVPTLWSNDYSVMVQAEGSDLIFETEHVINVKVKKGDKVKAGQVVAEVSDYDAKNYAGLGLVEIGILKGGNPPSHVCLFDYLDDSIKEDSLAKITALKKSWEEYRGDSNIYDESKVLVPGCISRDPIEG